MYYFPTLLPLLLNTILTTNDSFTHNQLFEKMVFQRSSFLELANKINRNLIDFKVLKTKGKMFNVEAVTKFLSIFLKEMAFLSVFRTEDAKIC